MRTWLFRCAGGRGRAAGLELEDFLLQAVRGVAVAARLRLRRCSTRCSSEQLVDARALEREQALVERLVQRVFVVRQRIGAARTASGRRLARVGSSESRKAARSKPPTGLRHQALPQLARRACVDEAISRGGRRPGRAGTGAAAAGAAGSTRPAPACAPTDAGSSASGLARTASRLILAPTWASPCRGADRRPSPARAGAAPPAARARRRRCAAPAAAGSRPLRWDW